MKTFSATVNVSLKKSVLDPQGKTVQQALEAAGFRGTSNLRVGKTITLRIESPNEADARKKLEEMCERLLVNPVIEEYALRLEAAPST